MRLLCALTMFLLGCRDEPAADSDWQAQSPRLLSCKRLAEATCARLTDCAPRFARVFSCVATLTDQCFRSAGLMGSQRTVAHVEACADATRARACPELLARYPEVCEVPPGLLADGVPCAFDEQCRTNHCARGDSVCGVCAPRPAIAIAELGQACGPAAPCSRLLFCDIDRCAPRKKLGEACAGVGQCDPYEAAVCNETFRCETARIARLGEACTLIANGLVLCEPPARCIDDRCMPAKREGAPCLDSHECDGECIRGRCVVRTVETCQK